MDQRTSVGLFIGIVIVLAAVCYFLPPSNEFEEPERPVYYETTMSALDLDGKTVVSVIETDDLEILKNADALVLNYTSPEFDDYEETVAFLNERMRAGQAVVSLIGSSVFSSDGMSLGIGVDTDVFAIAYSPELNAPAFYAGGSYFDAMENVAEWLYDLGYPDIEAPEPSWHYDIPEVENDSGDVPES